MTRIAPTPPAAAPSSKLVRRGPLLVRSGGGKVTLAEAEAALAASRGDR